MPGAIMVLFAVLAALVLFGSPLGFAMLAAGIAYLFWGGLDIGLLADQVAGRLEGSYTLVAVPMFIFAANVMNGAKITDRIVNVAAYAFGRLPGGFAHANVASSVVFSGMSGSAIADVAGPGRVIMRLMTHDGRYTPGYAGAVTAASATIGPIIPPSIPVLIYASVSNASVGALFVGGVIPGLMMALAIMGVIAVQAHFRGMAREAPPSLNDFGFALLEALLPILMPVIMLGGLYLGITTATEAAAVAAFYALVLATLVYRTMSMRALLDTLIVTARETAIVSITIAGAFIISFAIANERLPDALSAFLLALDLTPFALLIAINILFLLLGCVLDVSILLLVLVPLLIPSIVLVGVDLVHFGVVVIINIMIGLVTPPYGLLLFIIAALNDTSLREIIREIWPFIAALLCVLLLLVFFPQLVLWLPEQLGLH